MCWKLNQGEPISEKPSLSHFNILATTPSEDMHFQHQRYLEEIKAWNNAFSSLFQIRHTISDEKDLFALLLLRIHYLQAYIIIVHFLETDEIQYNTSLDLFVEIVSLSNIILNSVNHAFFFDFRTIWPLSLVTKKYREPVVWHEAIRLLVYKPRKEGL